MRILLPALLAAAPTLAQETATPADAVRATLSTTSSVATSEAVVDVEFAFETSADCKVPQTFLTGHLVEAYVGDTMRHRFEASRSGMVDLAAGTRVARSIPIDFKLIFGGDVSAEGVHSVTLRWPGVEGAEARLQVFPDQSGIDLDKLDLRETHVKLLTSEGEIELSFFPDKAPNHVRNFIKLSKDGFYNNTRFHRVIRGFMVQGGCPHTKPGATGMPGTGDAGYKIDAEFNDTKHVRGILSAARSNDPNSAGSQFFLMHGEAPHLDGQYTAYGKVDKGLDVLDKIATTRVGGPQRSTPVEPMHLFAAVVLPVYED